MMKPDELPRNLAEIAQSHVDYEVARWTGAQLAVSLEAEITAAFARLSDMPVANVLTVEVVDRLLDIGLSITIRTEFAETVADGFSGVRRVASASGASTADLMDRADFENLVDVFIEMKQIQRVVIQQITESKAYSELISHVLYTGIKNYVLKESVVARRLPGASSLMRMGQHALSSAAPNMEKSIDRQLVGFVNANIQDSVRESRQYLETALDPELLRAVAAEFWDGNAGQPLSAAADLVSPDSMSAIAGSAADISAKLQKSAVFRELLTALARDFVAAHSDESVATLLGQVGVTESTVNAAVTRWIPAVANLTDDYVAARIEAELMGFYSQYAGQSE
jgi:hypothetical protein